MPADWLEHEPATVPDPDAEKPEEWSDEDDGEREAKTQPKGLAAGTSPRQ
jgi:calnexin